MTEEAAPSPNRRLIETYFATRDRSALAPLLADDVEWVEWVDGVPESGGVHRGKQEYLENSGDEELTTRVSRWIEQGQSIVAEGRVRVDRKDGKVLHVQFVDLFEIEGGRIRRKSSYGALLQEPVSEPTP